MALVLLDAELPQLPGFKLEHGKHAGAASRDTGPWGRRGSRAGPGAHPGADDSVPGSRRPGPGRTSARRPRGRPLCSDSTTASCAPRFLGPRGPSPCIRGGLQHRGQRETARERAAWAASPAWLSGRRGARHGPTGSGGRCGRRYGGATPPACQHPAEVQRESGKRCGYPSRVRMTHNISQGLWGGDV